MSVRTQLWMRRYVPRNAAVSSWISEGRYGTRCARGVGPRRVSSTFQFPRNYTVSRAHFSRRRRRRRSALGKSDVAIRNGNRLRLSARTKQFFFLQAIKSGRLDRGSRLLLRPAAAGRKNYTARRSSKFRAGFPLIIPAAAIIIAEPQNDGFTCPCRAGNIMHVFRRMEGKRRTIYFRDGTKKTSILRSLKREKKSVVPKRACSVRECS